MSTLNPSARDEKYLLYEPSIAGDWSFGALEGRMEQFKDAWVDGLEAQDRRVWLVGDSSMHQLSSAFLCLFQALREGMSLGVGYGIWAACGVALTAVLSAVIFHEPLTLPMGIGIAAVMGGVLLVEIGSQQAQNTPDTAREQKEATAR